MVGLDLLVARAVLLAAFTIAITFSLAIRRPVAIVVVVASLRVLGRGVRRRLVFRGFVTRPGATRSVSLPVPLAIAAISLPGSFAIATRTGPLPSRPGPRMRRPIPRPGPLPTAVTLRLDTVQRVLQRTDQNLAPLVVGHLGLLDQRDGRREGFNRTGVLSGGGIRDGSSNSGTANGAVPRHNLLELGLAQLGCYAVLGEGTTRRFPTWARPWSAGCRTALGVKVGRGTTAG